MGRNKTKKRGEFRAWTDTNHLLRSQLKESKREQHRIQVLLDRLSKERRETDKSQSGKDNEYLVELREASQEIKELSTSNNSLKAVSYTHLTLPTIYSV